MEARISICIPTFNRADLLFKALKSVANQTKTPYEVFVVDNCSSDNTEEVVSRFKNVKFYRNPHNLGLIGNWNRCIELATGEFMTIFHSDDLISPYWYEEWSRIIAQNYDNKDIGAFCSAFCFIDVNDKLIIKYSIFKKMLVLKQGENFKKLWGRNHCGIPASGATIFKRSIFTKLGNYVQRFGIETDSPMNLKIINNYSILYYPKILYAHRIHEYQGFREKKEKKNDERKFNLQRSYLKMLKNFYENELNVAFKAEFIYKKPVMMYYCIAIYNLLTLNFKRARTIVSIINEIFPKAVSNIQDYFILFSMLYCYIVEDSWGRISSLFDRNFVKKWVE